MRKRGKKGFTLIELLIVIAIIGILAAVLIPNLLRARQVSQDRAAQAYARNVYTAGQAFLAENVQAAVIPDTDCTRGFNVGSWSVDDWGPVSNCVISASATAVTVTYSGGTQTVQTVP